MGLVVRVLYSGISRVKLLCCYELVVASGDSCFGLWCVCWVVCFSVVVVVWFGFLTEFLYLLWLGCYEYLF